MLKPRNNFVILKLIEKSESRHGSIVVPANNDCYCEGEVMAIGPGSMMAGGARADTFDLAIGQRVWVKHKEKRQSGDGRVMMIDCGVPYQDAGVSFHGFDEKSILGIIAEPGEAPPVDLTPTVAKEKSQILLN